MDIQEDENDSQEQPKTNSNQKSLSLRKQKQSKQQTFKNPLIPQNDILNGEIILENEQIEFIHKKRYRLSNNKDIIKNDSTKKYKDYE